MDDTRLIDRREFTLESALAILTAATITISGCGGSDSPAPAPSPNPNPNPGPGGGATGAISGNHGHTASITAAELTAGSAIRLTITGTATHPHTVDLSGAEVMQIAARQQVSKTSSTDDAHSHVVTFN